MPGRRQRLALLRARVRQPVLVVARRHDGDRAAHHRVVGAAELGAQQMVAAGRVGLEPELRVAARQRFHLDTQRRNIQAVDDVLRDHADQHRLAHRHVQVVDLGLAGRVLEFPHPLPPDRVDFQCAGRHMPVLVIEARGPDEEKQRQHERDDHPAHLDQHAAVLAGRAVHDLASPVADGEPADGNEDRHRQQQRDDGERQDDAIDLDGARGGGLRPKPKKLLREVDQGEGSRERPATSAMARPIGMRARVWAGSVQA